MKLPNFLIIGAAKGGTTSLYAYLSQHPQVFMSVPKEPTFFGNEGTDGLFHGPHDEDRAYHSYMNEKHEDYRDYDKLTREKQTEYWEWRHDHPDEDARRDRELGRRLVAHEHRYSGKRSASADMYASMER